MLRAWQQTADSSHSLQLISHPTTRVTVVLQIAVPFASVNFAMHSHMLQKAVLLILCSFLSITSTNSWQLRSPVLHHETNFRHPIRQLHKSPTSVRAAIMTDSAASNEAWTKPRLHNTGAFRSMAILGALAVAGLSSNSPFHLLSAQSMAALHMFSYATWFGTMVYTTFILGLTMFRNLPRKTFGNLQAKLFPIYFALSSIAIILQVSLSFVVGLKVKCFISSFSECFNKGVSYMPAPFLAARLLP
jgi:hypothetical protein